MSSILETFSIYQLECRKKYFLKEIKKIEDEINERRNINYFGLHLHNSTSLMESEVKLCNLDERNMEEVDNNIIKRTIDKEENQSSKIKIKVRKMNERRSGPESEVKL